MVGGEVASWLVGLLNYVTVMKTKRWWEVRWHHGWWAGLQILRSGFKPWPWILCCVLGQDTFLITLIVPLSTQVYKWVYQQT